MCKRELSFAAVVRIRGMDQDSFDNLPPELDELGQRMMSERPVASGRALDNAMTRAQKVSEPRKSLLWRASAPQVRRKGIAAVAAAVLAASGATALTMSGASAAPPCGSNSATIINLSIAELTKIHIGEKLNGGVVVSVVINPNNPFLITVTICI